MAGKQPGCFFGGITLKSGRKGFAIYREGKVVERYVGRGTLEVMHSDLN